MVQTIIRSSRILHTFKIKIAWTSSIVISEPFTKWVKLSMINNSINILREIQDTIQLITLYYQLDRISSKFYISYNVFLYYKCKFTISIKTGFIKFYKV